MPGVPTTLPKVAGVFLAVVFVVAILPTTTLAQTSAKLSKAELKTLLMTARTPQGQQRLALYFRDRAQHLNFKSQEFAKYADWLATQSKRGVPCSCASPYRHFSEEYAKEGPKLRRTKPICPSDATGEGS